MKDGFVTFEDLKFEVSFLGFKLPFMKDTKMLARAFFSNGYGVSVITGGGAYGDAEHPYELAVLKGTEENAELCYDTPITDDVIGYLTADDVTKHMIEVQKLEKAQ